MTIRVVKGEIDARDATTRVVLPIASVARWPPFERVTETIATPRRPFPRHKHEGVEVLTYVIDGSASYAFEPAAPRELSAGSTILLTAPTATSHAINPRQGHTVRWFSVVAALPPKTSAAPGLQVHRVMETEVEAEGAIVRRLVGPGTPLTSTAGLEGVALEYRNPGATFLKVGHDRVAVCYALSGHGKIDNENLDAGEAAFVEQAAGVAVQGQVGFQVALASAPRPGSGPVR